MLNVVFQKLYHLSYMFNKLNYMLTFEGILVVLPSKPLPNPPHKGGNERKKAFI